ncbi:MAG TPA: hypothetical protein VIK99_06140, partial [Thermaerobacter sp.]
LSLGFLWAKFLMKPVLERAGINLPVWALTAIGAIALVSTLHPMEATEREEEDRTGHDQSRDDVTNVSDR